MNIHYCVKMKRLLIFCVVLAINYVHCAVFRVDPLVLIEQGLVRGQKIVDGKYSAFLGIPYAKVSLENPFGPAEPHPGFEEEIYNAYDGSIRCPQRENVLFSSKDSNIETIDCLRLNIFVPNEASSRNPLPVLVWIHGGGFQGGSAHQGVGNLVKHGIVVVTINYRLGVYGFMCLDVPSIPGNQGLKDQYEALRWIRRNIASFGGNPYNVTIAGESAGAASVLLHLYSDNDKFFNKVIAESGSPLNEGMFVKGDVGAALKLATHLGLNTSNTEEALDFLAKSPYNLVTAAAKDVGLDLKPCQEKKFDNVVNFITAHPYSLSNVKKVRNTPILIGHTSQEHEGLINVYGNEYLKTDPFFEKIRNNFNLDDETLVEVAQIVRNFYIGDATISADVVLMLQDFESDFVFNHPVQRIITKLLNENANIIYQYLFSYVGDSGASGAPHAAEMNYLFEQPNVVRSEEEQLLVNRITTLWTNFVKFGNPTPKATDLVPVIWESITTHSRPYLVIDSDIRLESRIFKDRMAFWDLFYLAFEKYNIYQN